MTLNEPVFIGVDLGGTNIEAAAVQNGKVLQSKKKKTHAEEGVETVLDRIEKTVRRLFEKLDAEAEDFAGLCIGAPGAIDIATGVVREAPNLPGWKNIPLGKILQERLGLPVTVDNDVNVGVLGEYVYGAGRGALDMVGIWVGTGIGGGLVVNGQPVHGWRGAAGEIGHTVINPHGRMCSCGREGCVEAYASKTAMMSMIREQMARGRESVVPQIMEDKGKRRMTSSVIEAALEAGDALMAEAVKTSQFYLGLLTANLVNVLDPQVLVFGGGLVERLGQSFVAPIAHTARKYYLQQENAERIRIVPAALGDDAGPVGAAVIAYRRLYR
ncbi:MAG: ROK family protein [Anaerolineae bacterium]